VSRAVLRAHASARVETGIRARGPSVPRRTSVRRVVTGASNLVYAVLTCPTPRSASMGSSRLARTSIGVLLSLLAGGLLLWASLVFVFYGYCEDACDKPPRAFGSAVEAALPFALVGVGLMAVACYLFMRGRPSTPPSLFKAIVLAFLSSAGYVAGLWLVAVGAGTFTRSDSATPFILGMLVLVPVWMRSTIAVATRAARSSPRSQF
jgi:hypothetical protein